MTQISETLKNLQTDNYFSTALHNIVQTGSDNHADFDANLAIHIARALRRIASYCAYLSKYPAYTAYHPSVATKDVTAQKRIACTKDDNGNDNYSFYVRCKCHVDSATCTCPKTERILAYATGPESLIPEASEGHNLFESIVDQKNGIFWAKKAIYLPKNDEDQLTKELELISICRNDLNDIIPQATTVYIEHHNKMIEAGDGGILVIPVYDPFNTCGLGFTVLYGVNPNDCEPPDVIDCIEFTNVCFRAIREREISARVARSSIMEQQAVIGAWALHELRNQGQLVHAIADRMKTTNSTEDHQLLESVGSYLKHMQPTQEALDINIDASWFCIELRKAYMVIWTQFRGFSNDDNNNKVHHIEELKEDKAKIFFNGHKPGSILVAYRVSIEILRNAAKDQGSEFQMSFDDTSLIFTISVPAESDRKETLIKNLKKAGLAWNSGSLSRGVRGIGLSLGLLEDSPYSIVPSYKNTTLKLTLSRS